MSNAKDRYARNDIEKDCKVLLYKLSKSDIKSLQKNPEQRRERLEPNFGIRGCSVSICRLTDVEIENARKNASKTTASYLPEETPNELIRESSELSLQAERNVERGKKIYDDSVYFTYDIYFNMFKRYLEKLEDNQPEMERELSERNINKELILPNNEVNIRLVLWIIWDSGKIILNSLINGHWDSIQNAAIDAMNNTKKGESSTENESLLFINVPKYEVDPSSTGDVPKNIWAKQHSEDHQDVPLSKCFSWRVIGLKDYLFPEHAPALPKSAIALMCNCSDYLEKLKKTNVNGNQMWLESAYHKEHIEMNSIQEKIRNENLGNIQKKNIARITTRKKGKILTKMICQIKYRRGFLNDFLS